MDYKNKNLPVEQRVEDLINQMTLKEKIGQLNQKMLGWNGFRINKEQVELTDEFKDEVAFGHGLGAIYGVSRADGWNSHVTDGITPIESIKVANKMQRYIIENTRLQIPLLLTEECPHGHEALGGTTFPTNIGIGSTWNPDLYEEVCSIISEELRIRGGHLALISTLDITTDPRWGRTEECYSEDPYLAARFCEKAVTGLQGDYDGGYLAENKSVAVLKHFCGQGATIGGHNGKSTNIGIRELREIHLMGMAAGAKAGALGCMAAYNDLDGIPCHSNGYLLTNILREEMGFEGFVMSDGVGVDRLKPVTGSLLKSGAVAVNAGVDLNLWNDSFLELEEAVNQGLLNEKAIDTAVKRILKAKFALGLFENPYVREEPSVYDKPNEYDNPAEILVGNKKAVDTALNIAREVPVLLKNESFNGSTDKVLPFSNDIKKIAVVGPNSDAVYNQLGDYTQWQEEGKVITVLQGIKNQAPEDVMVSWTKGCAVRSIELADNEDHRSGNENHQSDNENHQKNIEHRFTESISICKDSDVIVAVLGGSSTREAGMDFDDNGAVFMNKFTEELDCGEAVDLADIQLGGEQVKMVKELSKLGKPIVVVLIQGRPHAIPWIAENVSAILCGWYPGEQGGKAIAEIMFGKMNPSGRLPVSVPRSAAQLPVYYNRKDITDYVDMEASPLYSFGYGLSYTTFEYTDMYIEEPELTVKDLEEGKRFTIHVTIGNTGECDGKETVQLYIYDMESTITRRIQELKDFKKVFIKKGESRIVKLSLGFDELCVYSSRNQVELEPGNVKVMIGSSCDRIYMEELIKIQ